MSQSAAAILRLLSGRIESVVAEISDEDFEKRPGASLNPPVWLLGHLAVSIDAVSKFAGEPYHLSEEWHSSFNAHSTPFENETPYPSKAEILAAYSEVVDRSINLMDNMSADQLAAAHGLEGLASTPVKSTEDMVTLLLTGHIGWHLGHLEWAAKLLNGVPAAA